MTIIPAINQYENYYVFNTHDMFTNYVAITVSSTNPNINSILLNNSPRTLSWETVHLNGNTYYYGVLALPAGRHILSFYGQNAKFGAIIYGSSENDTYALPAGIKLDLATDLPSQGTCNLYEILSLHTVYVYTILQLLHQFKMQY